MSTDLRHPVPSSTPPPSVGSAAGRALPLVVGFALVAFGTVAGLALWTDALAQVEETRTTHPAVDRLVLDLGANGAVEVVVHDADEIVVEQHTRSWFRDVDVSQSVEGDALRITTTRCNLGWVQFGDQCSASFVVTVPASTSVVAEVSFGEIVLAGLEGQAQLRTGHGQIDVTDVGGRLDLRTGHGNVAISRAGDDVVVQTGHGEVVLTDVRGGARVTTGHGNVTTEGIAGPLEATTDHGGVDASATRSSTVTLHSGHGRIAFTPAVAPRTAVLETSHGDIAVRVPPDTPPFAVNASASGREVGVGIATDPDADRSLDLRTGHGTVSVGYVDR